jgi:hypothetical protein
MPAKSFSLLVIMVRLLANAVAAIIASGVLILLFLRKATQWIITAGVMSSTVLSAIKFFTFSPVVSSVFQQSNSIYVMTESLGTASITASSNAMPAAGSEADK